MAYGDREITAEQQRQIQLPKKFKCRQCGKFKEPVLFANKELNKYRWQASQGARAGSVTAQLRCRGCTGNQLHERQCEGPCGIWKELKEFSKSSRTINGSNWCKGCIMWKEAAESSVTVQAAPTYDLAPDEDAPLPPVQPSATTNNVSYASDPEGGDGSDDDWEFTPIPYAAPATQVHGSAPSSAVAAHVATSMSQLSIGSQGWGTQGSQPATSTSRASGSAPHLRGNPGNVAFSRGQPRKPSGTNTASSVSNPYENQSDATSQAGSAPKKNAWDTQGVEWINKQFAADAHSNAGSTYTSTTTTTTTSSTTMRQVAPAAAAPRSSGWAKAVGSRNMGPQYNALDYQTRPRRQENNGDEDDM